VGVWGRLDWECGWEDRGGVGPEVAAAVAKFKPEWALVVDWSAVGAYQALAAQTGVWEQAGASLPKMTYLNYRVYTLSETRVTELLRRSSSYKERSSSSRHGGGCCGPQHKVSRSRRSRCSLSLPADTSSADLTGIQTGTGGRMKCRRGTVRDLPPSHV